MINKLLLNAVCAIALFSLTGIAVAGLPDSKVNPFSNEQKSLNQTEISAFEESDTPTTKPTAHEPTKNHTKSSVIDSDNYNWVPIDWYSTY